MLVRERGLDNGLPRHKPGRLPDFGPFTPAYAGMCRYGEGHPLSIPPPAFAGQAVKGGKKGWKYRGRF